MRRVGSELEDSRAEWKLGGLATGGRVYKIHKKDEGMKEVGFIYA